MTCTRREPWVPMVERRRASAATERCRATTEWDGSGGEAGAATERRRHEEDCSLPSRAWREPRAKGAGPMWRLGETRRTS
jgi:hypothetical protein